MAKRFLQPDRFDVAWEYPKPCGPCLRPPIQLQQQQQVYNFPPPAIIGQKRSFSSVLTSVPPPPIIGHKRSFMTVLTRVPPPAVKKINPFDVVTKNNPPPPAAENCEPTNEKTEVWFPFDDILGLFLTILILSKETKLCGDQVEFTVKKKSKFGNVFYRRKPREPNLLSRTL
jgi:hypothetical protein